MKRLVPAMAVLCLLASCAGSAPLPPSSYPSAVAKGLADGDSFALAKEDTADSPEAERGSLAPAKPSGGADEKATLAAGASEAASIESAQLLSTSSALRIKKPAILVRKSGEETTPLPLRALDVSCLVSGATARIVFDMTFENSAATRPSGTLYFALPEGASPSYLAYYASGLPLSAKPADKALLAPDKPLPEALRGRAPALASAWQAEGSNVEWKDLKEARVVNPVKGREVYERTVRKRVDPALAEWSGSGVFTTTIYPIPESSLFRVVFAFDRPVPAEGSRFALPLPVPDELGYPARFQAYFLSPASGARLDVAGKAAEGGADSGFSFRPAGDFEGAAILSWTAKEMVVDWGLDAELGKKLVHVRVQPPVAEASASAASGAAKTGRALFLVDTSWSEAEGFSPRSGKLLREILERDAGIDSFAVVSFDVKARGLTAGFRKNGQEERAGLYAALDKVWLEGATDFKAALDYVASDAALAAADTVFLLSDGNITWGPGSSAELQAAYPAQFGRRWICYRFGDRAVNSSLFDRLARAGGMVAQVPLSGDLSKAAVAHLAGTVRLESVGTAEQDELGVAGDPGSLYPGQVLDIALTLPAGRTGATLVLSYGGGRKSYALALGEEGRGAEIAKRRWASIQAARLLDVGDAGADRVALALSQRFNLVNRAASFILLEREEDYVREGIAAADLDVSGLVLRRSLAAQERGAGEPEMPAIGDPASAYLAALAATSSAPAAPWTAKPRSSTAERKGMILDAPANEAPKGYPSEYYYWALKLKGKPGYGGDALRVLSTIAERNPADDSALRLVGFVLMDWACYDEAAALFAKVRERRPFEPQSWMAEAMALAAAGDYLRAARRFEAILAGSFDGRFNDQAKEVARKLYLDLLASSANSADAVLASAAKARAAELARKEDRAPAGRIVLLWNLDNTDVDLHVIERIPGRADSEVYFSTPSSPSGGRLYWDNTAGLGPEIYEHPTLSKEGFEAFVHYFGSSAVEGAAPSATLAFAFVRDAQGLRLSFDATLLMDASVSKVPIVPGRFR